MANSKKEAQWQYRILNYVANNQFMVILISILFFFAWSDYLMISMQRMKDWITLALWLVIIIGLTVPIMLLVGTVQYKSPIAYGVTMTIFLLTILTNLSSLPYYIQEYLSEYSQCSCCPICEIKSIIKLVLLGVFAIYLMNREKLATSFKWSKTTTLKLFFLVLILYSIFEVLT